MTHKLINIDSGHYFSIYLKHNRSTKSIAQNKTGPHQPQIGRSKIQNDTFLYQAVKMYTLIPRQISLLEKSKNFRFWLKRFYFGSIENIPYKDDNIEDINPDINKIVNYQNIQICEDIQNVYYNDGN